MITFKDIKNYLINNVGYTKDNFNNINSIFLANAIMLYAHRNQTRENGENYAMHPLRCYQTLTNLIDYPNVDKRKLAANNIPYDGALELCLLHDVVEDSDITFDELKEMFAINNLKSYYENYIETPLHLITHDKKVPYEIYINICMEHPTSALVKFLDLLDNINFTSLKTFDQKNYERCQSYLKYAFTINNKYHFVENFQLYRQNH